MEMKMYRVLQLGKHYPPFIGGTEKVIKLFTEKLNYMGVRCDVLCSNDKPYYEEKSYGNYKVMKIPSYFRILSTTVSPGMVLKLKEIQNNYDIIHIHMPDPMANVATFLTKPKGRIVMHWHMDIARYRGLLHLYKPFLIWLFRRADVVIVSSKSLREESEFSKYMEGKARILPLPINRKELMETQEDMEYASYLKKISNDRKIILSVGRLVYYKGFDTLIKSARYLPSYCVVFIVGDGPMKKQLSDMIVKYNLENKVFMLGKLNINQLVTCYKLCDVFCLPSKYKTEAFGLVQVEAMVFGKPIVSTKLQASGTCEVNIDKETGLCVKPDEPTALAEALLKIIDNKELYKYFSERARERAKFFDVDNVTNKLMKIYKEIL
ncbi:MAG: glycosyltransferase [Acidobacteria bacterium]|nr:MAG: glycosyltransferase [Acidobacteriota bacterium]